VRRVYKYPIPVTDMIDLSLPAGAQPLHVAAQGEMVCLWALVDPEAEPVARRFIVRGTGHPIENDDADLSHVGTFLLQDGALVFHLFEVIP